MANGPDSYGVQAYRWVLMAGIAILGVLASRQLDTLDRTIAIVWELKESVGTLKSTTESRFNAQADRLAEHGQRINQLEKDNRDYLRRTP